MEKHKLTLGSLFDGIGGFPLAAERCGVETLWASEIEAFPIEVTKRHFPMMRHLGDVTTVRGDEIEPVDIITFGSPCQDLSVAGKRAGLEGSRSSLFYEAIRIINEMRRKTSGRYPRFAVWENVPGALSSNQGEDFRAVVEAFAEIGAMDIAWRILDARYFGVPQRRRRVFVVADFGGERARDVLFECEGMSGDSATGGNLRQTVPKRTSNGAGAASVFTVCLGSEPLWAQDTAMPLTCRNGDPGVVCYDPKDLGRRPATFEDFSPSLKARAGTGGNNVPVVKVRYRLRRLTPTECERLQGFPDGWTSGGPDSKRYKALGNSVAVVVIEWIMRRLVDILGE